MRLISYLANPARFLRFSRFATPTCGWSALVLIGIGLVLALFISPPAIEHGEAVRMMYVHVPAAWCAMAAYSGIAIASFVSFVWRHSLADSVARSLALPGAAFTFLALVTGSLWGRHFRTGRTGTAVRVVDAVIVYGIGVYGFISVVRLARYRGRIGRIETTTRRTIQTCESNA